SSSAKYARSCPTASASTPVGSATTRTPDGGPENDTTQTPVSSAATPRSPIGLATTLQRTRPVCAVVDLWVPGRGAGTTAATAWGWRVRRRRGIALDRYPDGGSGREGGRPWMARR